MTKEISKTEAKKRIQKLKKLIRHHRYLYHVLDKQEISDSALDSLKKELFDLEQKFPEFITLDSPTQRVGGQPLGEFEKVQHSQPMLSINDAFLEEDMKDWLERISKLLTQEEREKIDFYCEPKLDGLAIELIYRNGIFKIGSTRGNGVVGENVTQNLKTIEAIPLRLRDREKVTAELEQDYNPPTSSSHPPEGGRALGLKEIAQNIRKKEYIKIVAKGEVVITKKEFERVNKQRKKEGLPVYANPRNLAAGSIRQLNPKIAASRNLDSNLYSLITDFGQKTHQQEHKILEILGFKTNNKHNRFCKSLEEVFNFHDFWKKNRDKLPYEIDGIVVNINSNQIFKKLGTVGKAHRGVIAYKFPFKQATTVVQDIKVQVGRTGALTPVAILKPVKIGGVTVSRATLHNEDEIKKLGVKIGDTVIVGRAGDVIPDVIKVLSELRTGKEKRFSMPRQCPACGTKTIRLEGEAVWRCKNPKCSARQLEYFSHFISRGAFDIEGLGFKIVERLIEEGLISDPADLFELKEGDLIPLERFAEKSAQNLIDSIQSSKEIPLTKFIYALGIRNIGEQTAIDLANHFRSLKGLKEASLQDLEEILDIGPVVAKSIFDWFRNKDNLKFSEKLEKVGVKIKEPEKRREKLILAGKTFILTGTLKTITRDEAKTKIRELGGKISSSVSEKVDFVLAGESPGSKYNKAKKLGLKIISEKEFSEMIKA